MAYEVLLCWEVFLTATILCIACTLIYQLCTTTKSKIPLFYTRMSIAVISCGFASVTMDLTHIAINIAAEQPILNLFYPSIYVVFNFADGLWMAETLLLYLLYFGRVYLTFKPSAEFALKRPIIIFFSFLITLNFSANVCYFLTAFAVIQIPVIIPSIREGAADMFLMTTWLDLLVNSVLLTLFISKLRVIQTRTGNAIHGKQTMLTAMTKVTVLGIVAMVSTQLIYIYALIMFFVIGENDTSYQLFYAFRGTNIMLDAVAVYCNLGTFGGGLYRFLFGKCDHCVYHCCKRVALEGGRGTDIELHGKKAIALNVQKGMHPVDSKSDMDFEDGDSPKSTDRFTMS